MEATTVPIHLKCQQSSLHNVVHACVKELQRKLGKAVDVLWSHATSGGMLHCILHWQPVWSLTCQLNFAVQLKMLVRLALYLQEHSSALLIYQLKPMFGWTKYILLGSHPFQFLQLWCSS